MADADLQTVGTPYLALAVKGFNLVHVTEVSAGNWELELSSFGSPDIPLSGATDRASAEAAADSYMTSNFTTVRLSKAWVVGLNATRPNSSTAYFVEE